MQFLTFRISETYRFKSCFGHLFGVLAFLEMIRQIQCPTSPPLEREENGPVILGTPHLGNTAPLCLHGCLRLLGYLQKENHQLHHGDNGILWANSLSLVYRTRTFLSHPALFTQSRYCWVRVPPYLPHETVLKLSFWGNRLTLHDVWSCHIACYERMCGTCHLRAPRRLIKANPKGE